jgi:hypothetical protein
MSKRYIFFGNPSAALCAASSPLSSGHPSTRLEPISIGLERERGGGVVDIFPEMEMIDGAALFGRSA